MKMMILMLGLTGMPQVFADGRPVMPGPEIDKKLFGPLTPREFFEKRRKEQPGCVADLQKVKAQYQEKAALLRSALTLSPQELDHLESESLKLRKRMLELIQVCGYCATRPAEPYNLEGNGRDESWFLTDGSCILPLDEPRDLQKAFEKLSQSLTRMADYPKKHLKDRPSPEEVGFQNILKFYAVDSESGKELSNFVGKEGEPYLSYCAVKGPDLFKILFTGFSYFFTNTWTYRENASSFYYAFESTRPPEGFEPPFIEDFTASGKPLKGKLIPLELVKGQWYLKADGYMRYTTAADFPIAVKHVEKIGLEILLDTLVQLAERAVPLGAM